MSYEITLKRIYAPIEEHDGSRMLVDRLWPSGLSRRSLALNEWLERYSSELKTCPDKLLPLMKFTRAGRLTLLTAARQIEDSHLPVLKELTLSALAEEDASDRGFCSSPCLAHTLPTSHR